jgi:hypothetical protein
MRYVIAVYLTTISVYAQDDQGQLDGSRGAGDFPSVIAAADWVKAQGQCEVSILSFLPTALSRGAMADCPGQWYGVDEEVIRPRYRAVRL